jgi:hypothetical protein
VSFAEADDMVSVITPASSNKAKKCMIKPCTFQQKQVNLESQRQGQALAQPQSPQTITEDMMKLALNGVTSFYYHLGSSKASGNYQLPSSVSPSEQATSSGRQTPDGPLSKQMASLILYCTVPPVYGALSGPWLPRMVEKYMGLRKEEPVEEYGMDTAECMGQVEGDLDDGMDTAERVVPGAVDADDEMDTYPSLM